MIWRAFALFTVVGLLTSSTQAQSFLAGWDFDVPGDLDGDPNTPNEVTTEPGYTSIVATGSKVYNAVSNGVTFDFDASTTTGGNANRLRGGSVRPFALITDFIQVRNNNDLSDPPFPEASLSFSGLAPNTDYIFTFNNYNAGAFQQEHAYYQGDVATGTFLGNFTPSGNPNDPDNENNPFTPGVDFTLMSDNSGVVDVTITRTDGQRITFNGTSIATLGGGGILAGDFNNDSVVNLADYTLWRNNLGEPVGTLPNDDSGLVIGETQYNDWRANYGASNIPAIAAAVPEPSTMVLLGSLAGLAMLRLRKRS